MALEAQHAARSVAKSKPMGWLARAGLAARGIVYIGMGWLTALVVRGYPASPDQGGVLAWASGKPMGKFVVAVIAAGFLGYAIWRFSEVVFGVGGTDDGLLARARSFIRGAVYLGLFFVALSVLRGSGGSQSGKQKQLAASALSHPGGNWVVAAVGLFVLGSGVVMIAEGLRTEFLKYFEQLPPGRRHIIVWLGRVGGVARGLVFAMAGSLVIYSALASDPSKAGGIDSTLRTLIDQPYGPLLGMLMAVGLLIFGVYGLAEAAWRRVPEGDGF